MLGPIEYHPYGIFIPKGAHSIIIGSFPIAIFTSPMNPKKGEIDFFYGGKRNQLWKILSICFERELKNEKQIKNFLSEKCLALGDVIKSCQRINGGSLDSDLKNCEYFIELAEIIPKNNIKTLYFTSSKVQNIFRQKIGVLEGTKEILLLSPSAGGLRKIGKKFQTDLKYWKKIYPDKKLTEFRVYLYKKIFSSLK